MERNDLLGAVHPYHPRLNSALGGLLLAVMSGCLTSREEFLVLLERASDWDLDGHLRPDKGGDDCDDDRADVHPGAAEDECDGVDEDCDGVVDEGVLVTYFPDEDGDGVGVDESAVALCEPPGWRWAFEGGDCDDHDPGVSPRLDEVCGDGLDNDCDGGAGACAPGVVSLAEVEGVVILGADWDEAAGTIVGSTRSARWSTPALLVGGGGHALYVFATPLRGDLTTAAHSARVQLSTDQIASGASILAAADVGDVDGDGVAELAVSVADRGADAWEVWLLPDVGEGFRLDQDAPLAVLPFQDRDFGALGARAQPIGDLSGDEVDDVYIATPEAEVIGRLFPGGGATMEEAFSIVGPEVGVDEGHAVLGRQDLDGDGRLDLALGSWELATGRVHVQLGPMEGVLDINELSAQRSPPAGVRALGLALGGGDVDGDGHVDMVAAGFTDDAAPAGLVLVQLGPLAEGAATFGDWSRVVAEPEDEWLLTEVLVEDLDDDGRGDLILASPYQSEGQYGEMNGAVAVVLSTGPGTTSLRDAHALYLGGANADLAGWDVAVLPAPGPDDLPSLFIGVPGDDRGRTDAGAAVLVPFTSL